jgi:DNA-binding NarL/FixJ family response regulator
MDVWRRVLSALGTLVPEVNSYPVDVELARAIQFLAEEERRSEAEVTAELVDLALSRHAARVDWNRHWRNLSPREKQVAVMVGNGYSTPEIAAELVVSENTVKSQLKSALRKFDVHSRGELTAILDELGLLNR